MYQRSYTPARVLLAVFLCGIFLPGLCKAAPPIQISWAPQNPGRGQLTVNMDGYSKTFLYGENDTAASLAAAIGGTLSLDSASPVWARGERDGSVTMRLRRAAGTALSVCLTPQGSSGCPGAPGTQITTDKTAILPPLTTSMTLGCTPNPLQSGSELTCTTQTPSGATGGVTFYLDGNLFSSTQPTPSGVSIAKTTQSLTSGLHMATAGYAKSLFYPSASSLFSFSVQGGSGGGGGGSGSTTALYSFEISEWSDNGNVNKFKDSVNGSWEASYDSLNRITSASQSKLGGVPYILAPTNASSKQNFCWQYDSFGNRTLQAASDGVFYSNCQTSGTLVAVNTPVDEHNRLKTETGYVYDDAGNVTDDGNQQYLYDGQGQLCASLYKVTGSMTGYLYDADGQRVAKGSLTSFSCDPAANGFTITTEYILGAGSEPLTELDGNGNLLRTNVHAGGRLIATFDANGQAHYQFTDWLGTQRMQTDAGGNVEQQCSGGVFGDQLNCIGNGSTDLHFTGKERDTESQLDYFGARYYASSLGRWLSPDWAAQATPIPFANLIFPQSLNMYAYAGNNALINKDADGHVCITGVNSASGFCVRAQVYESFDKLVGSKTVFFAATAMISTALGDAALPGFSHTYLSSQTSEFLDSIGNDLLSNINYPATLLIASGAVTGNDLDSRMVHLEQNEVQKQLDSLKAVNVDSYSKIISEVNAGLNGAVGRFFGHVIDRDYNQILDNVRSSLGRRIDFSVQGDRESIGNAVAGFIRQKRQKGSLDSGICSAEYSACRQ